MKQGLSFKLSQNLALTPQLQQAIKLLQMSQLELQEMLQEQVESNPFLVLDAPQENLRIDASGQVSHGVASTESTSAGMQESYISVSDTANPQSSESSGRDVATELSAQLGNDWDSTSDTYSNGSDGRTSDSNDNTDDRFEWMEAKADTLLEHLLTQVRLFNCDQATQCVLQALVESINDDGYFESDFVQLKSEIARHLDVVQDSFYESVFERAIIAIQGFDPPGVGATDLRNCLQLQLMHPCAADCVLDAKITVHRLALRVLAEGFSFLSSRDRAGLKKLLKCEDALLAAAIELIRQLDPKPGLAFGAAAIEYVRPEILVLKINGAWQARLNPAAVPALRVQETHAKYLKRGVAQTEAVYQQLHGARQLVRTVQQHFETVFRVGQAIVAAQQQYFEHGAIKLKPMVLKDISDGLGLHESTVSRVTTHKYLQTPHGVLEMKYFFSSGISGDDGESNSSTAIKSILLDLLKGEPTHKPLSDQALADALNERGYNVARRTVAKYREQLGYASAHARKPL